MNGQKYMAEKKKLQKPVIVNAANELQVVNNLKKNGGLYGKSDK